MAGKALTSSGFTVTAHGGDLLGRTRAVNPLLAHGSSRRAMRSCRATAFGASLQGLRGPLEG